MAVRKRGSRWQIDFRVRSIRYRIAVPEARTKAEALQAEAKVRSQIFEGRYEAAAKPVSFSDFLDKHYMPHCKANIKTWRCLKVSIKASRSFFAGKALTEVTPFMVEKYKLERIKTPTYRGTPRKPNTTNHELTTLSHVFNLAIRLGFLRANPAMGVRRMKCERRERYLTREEEDLLRVALDARPDTWLRDVTLIALNTGMRQGEILQLEWRRVDFSRGAMKLTGTKTCAQREVPINPEARALLESRPRDAEMVFAVGRKLPHRSTLDRQFREMVKGAGLTDFHFHDLRHTAATRMLDAGIRESVIARVLGHSSTAMTTTYAHVTDELTRAAVEAISRDDGHVLVTGDFSRDKKSA